MARHACRQTKQENTTAQQPKNKSPARMELYACSVQQLLWFNHGAAEEMRRRWVLVTSNAMMAMKTAMNAAADLYFRNKVAILLPQTHTAKLGHLRWECMGALVHICAPGAKPSQKENLWAAGLLSVRSCGACTASVH